MWEIEAVFLKSSRVFQGPSKPPPRCPMQSTFSVRVRALRVRCLYLCLWQGARHRNTRETTIYTTGMMSPSQCKSIDYSKPDCQTFLTMPNQKSQTIISLPDRNLLFSSSTVLSSLFCRSLTDCTTKQNHFFIVVVQIAASFFIELQIKQHQPSKMQEDQYQYDEDEYIYDQDCPEALESNHSNDHHESEDHNYNQQPYEILPLEKIYEELNAILEEVRMLVYLDRGWCLLLLKEFKWDKEILREEYFNKLEHYQKRIGLKPNLLTFDQCKQTVGVCYVCCCENVPIMQNICGHSFCLQCWSCSIQNGVQSGNPFLLCMDVTCGVPLLLEMVERMLTFTGDYALLKKWMKRVCELLIMENRNYQFCTGVDCGNCIKINRMDIDTVKCVCGKIFCFRCQSDDHYPCTCEQKTKWTQQVLSEEADAKWISSNAKICPWCKKAVERSMGCNFMSCTCGKNFCYMCSQPWEPDHKDHFKCHIYKKRPDEIVNRQKEVMQRMNHCTERYLFNQAVANNYKEIDVFAKRKHLFKVLGLQLTDSQFMQTAYKFAIECCQKLKWIYAFTFFNDMKNKKDAFEFSMGQYQKYKQNLLKLLAVDLKTFMNEVDNQQKNKLQGKINPKMIEYLQEKFRSLKKQIVNLYTCTKNYKEKFVQELQQITAAIDLQREIEEMKKYTATRSEDKKGKEEKGFLDSIISWGKEKTKSKNNKNN